ncbi:MAG: hypothetical protein ABEL76_07500 [Bradymonadaceae bacterium]
MTAAVELHACEQGRDGRDGFEDSSAWRNVRELLLPPAHAHVTGTALRLGTPYVDALTGPVDRARLYGAIAPPIGTYCRVYAVLAPADRDAVRAGGVAAETIRGHTLVVRGRYRSSPDDPWTSFTWRSDARRAVELEAVDPSTGEHPLGLNKPDGQTMLLIDKKLSGKVFDVPVDADDAGDRVLDNLADTLRMYTY